jgi:RHS repeat-associated protein
LVLTSVLNNFVSYSGVYLVGSFVSQTTPSLSATAMKHTMNMKVYELSNHLGNVLVTVSDARQILNTSSAVTGFAAIVKSATDYSAFGAPMAGRVYTSSSYRYGFNGKEKQDEMHGNSGDEYDFGARIYDARLGRWGSKDPLEDNYASISTYSYSGNSPIFLYDPDGRIILIHYKDVDGTYKDYPYTPGIKPTVDNEFLQSVNTAVTYAMGSDPNHTYQSLANDPNKIETITEGTDPNTSNHTTVTGGSADAQGNITALKVTTVWNPNLGSYTEASGDQPNAQAPSTILLHEAGHALDDFSAKTNSEDIKR